LILLVPFAMHLLLARYIRAETGFGISRPKGGVQAVVQSDLLADGQLTRSSGRASASARSTPAVGAVLTHLAVAARVFLRIGMERNLGLHHGTRLC